MESKKNGRPTVFSEELVDAICLRIASGESLRNICKDDKFPAMSTVLLWVSDGKHLNFSEQYNQACSVRAEVLFEESLEIADDTSKDYVTKENSDGSEYEVINTEHIQRSRLRVDTRKWYLSKVLPKKFGDKLDMTSGGEPIKSNTIIVKDFSDATDDKS